MFSALKKFVTNEQVQGRPNVPSGVQAMGQSLQRKFAKGVQYNMKVIIKGDRNTGKTTLFHRLQGERFKEEYIPTQEIQVTCIQWNYKATDDVVKVEVWDVVDKGKPRKKSEGLKLENTKDEEPDQPCLDAEFLDVYKGTNGVVMLLDITKQWTWTYVQRELPKVPNHIPVLVMANFRDMGEHRTVLDDEVRLYVENFERPTGSAHVQFAEASMKNGFGLKYLHTFFNVPFLQLQRETLLRQLETNQLELDATMEELDMRKESEDQNYLLYLENLEERRKQRKIRKSGGSADGPKAVLPNGQAQQASSLTPTPTPSASGSNPGSGAPSPSRGSPAHTPSKNTPTGTPTTTRRSSPSTQPASDETKLDPSPSSATPSEESEATDGQGASLTQRFSKWFSGGEGKVKQGTKEEIQREAEAVGVEPAEEVQQQDLKITSVEDFVPDEGLDSKFLEEPESKMKKAKAFFAQKVAPKQEKSSRHSQDSDSDENDDGNPMVAGFQEDLDSEDDNEVFSPPTENSVSTPANKGTTSYDVELSTDEDENPVMTKDEDISDDDDDVWKPPNSKSKSPNQISGSEDKSPLDGLLESSGTGQSAIASKNAVTVSQKAPSTDTSSTDDELPPGILDKNRTSSQTSDGDTTTTTSPMSAGLQLQIEDLNFLESVGSSKPKMQKRPSRTGDEFDALVTITQDEDLSDTDTMTSTSTSSSAKKKKHKNKDKHRDKDEDKSHKKHKHKKHKDKERERDDGSKDKSEKKKKKHRKKDSGEENAANADMNELEAFLEGPAGNYEAF